MNSSQPMQFFIERFGIDNNSLQSVLDTALERKVDLAELFFEHMTQESVSLEDGIVKSSDRHIQQGVGVRVQSKEQQGYAYSDEITIDAMQVAANTARAICEDGGAPRPLALSGRDVPSNNCYPIKTHPTDVPLSTKTELLNEIDRYARSQDSRITQVMASIVSQTRHIMISASDDEFVADTQPLFRLNAQVIAETPNGMQREIGYQGAGGRIELEEMIRPETWKPLVDEAIRLAVLNLSANPCPAGTMDVVLGPGWPGILLHEAIGHGLEGDFNRKRTSAFSDRLGERVACEGVTVVDDGTVPGRRGSINIDDEGTPAQRNVLIDDGILVGYLHDKMNARLMGTSSTGNGRRESYAHMPMPRMTNTFMLAGQDDPEEIIRSVSKGIYAVSFGGGQVDITSGKFVFSASEAYRIENGRVGEPLRGATLIGNGPDVLTRVRYIGNDLSLDRGVGTCGKDGQSVPVGVGMPTVRIDNITVGGTE